MKHRVTSLSMFSALVLVVGCSGVGLDDVAAGKGTLAGRGGAVGGIESNRLTSGTCPYSPAPAIHQHALCVCEDLMLAGTLETRSAAGVSADVGVNGRFSAATETRIAGALVARGGVGVAGDMSILGDLATRGDVTGAGKLEVGHDLSSGGDVRFAGQLQVGGALRVAGTLLTSTVPSTAARATYEVVGDPCGCDGSTFFDVGARVLAAKALNDNAKAGASIASGVLTVDAASGSLSTGNYYVAGIETYGSRKIRVEGAVAIHVDGDLVAAGDQIFELAPGASLDLFVSGNVHTAGDLRGSDDAPAGFRLYVGGDQVVHAGDQAFHGMLYAPRATVAFAGGAVVYGAVFAKEIRYAGSLTVDYRPASTPAPTACELAPSASGAPR